MGCTYTFPVHQQNTNTNYGSPKEHPKPHQEAKLNIANPSIFVLSPDVILKVAPYQFS